MLVFYLRWMWFVFKCNSLDRKSSLEKESLAGHAGTTVEMVVEAEDIAAAAGGLSCGATAGVITPILNVKTEFRRL